MQFIACLKLAGFYIEPKFPYGSTKIRYEHRFSPFYQVQRPAPITYENYIKSADYSKLSPLELLESGQEHLNACKKVIESTLKMPKLSIYHQNELEALLKVCKLKLLLFNL